MRRWIWMLAALAVFAVLPKGGTELGQLRPAAVLAVWQENGQIVMETDTGDSGSGSTLTMALEDLQQTTPGHLFLDTVENLLVSDDTQNLLPDLQRLLRPGVRVCNADRGDLEAAWEYLRSHRPEVILAEADVTGKLQKLRWEEGRCKLEGEGM